MSENEIRLELNRKDILALRWLLKSSADETFRPILACLHVREDGITESSNGKSLHQIPTPEALKPLVGKLLKPVTPLPAAPSNAYSCRVWIVEDYALSDEYPDTNRFSMVNDTPCFRACINPKILINTIQTMCSSGENLSYLVFDFYPYGPEGTDEIPTPIAITAYDYITDKTETRAVVMPLSLPYGVKIPPAARSSSFGRTHEERLEDQRLGLK